MILVDTNVLLRASQVGHAHHAPALDAMALLATRDNEQFAVAPQNLYEMYVVCTRPAAQNGLGMSPADAHRELANARALFQFLPETGNTYAVWEDLVSKYAISGKPAHDARVVAFMVDHQLRRILSFNDADFKRFSEVDCINPFDALGVPRI